MEPQNILTNQVNVNGPPAGDRVVEGGLIFRIQQGGHVAQQGIKPHIEGVIWVRGHGEAPGHIDPRNGKVLQAPFHKTQHFIAAGGGLNKIGPFCVQRLQLGLIF